MGCFYIQCTVQNIHSDKKRVAIKKMLVDTGTEYSWLPALELEKISVRPVKKDVRFVMANGQQITRDIGYAILRVDDFETVDEVVFAKEGDLNLLGARTMEGLEGFAAGPIPVASSTR